MLTMMCCTERRDLQGRIATVLLPMCAVVMRRLAQLHSVEVIMHLEVALISGSIIHVLQV